VAFPVPVQAAPGNDWKYAAAGGIHLLAVKKDGTLWAWGNNWAGSLGTGLTNDALVPAQVGSATNWVKVWASTLESVGLQSDGSLWYWGDNPNPAFAQNVGNILTPMRISPDTNWVDAGFGVNTVFAIKFDGTLWAFGRNAHVYTGAGEKQDITPMRVGTNTDWRGISAAQGWWVQGLIKKDGSLWLMDASEGKPNGPTSPYRPVRFRRAEVPRAYVACAAGAVHAAAPGVHGPIGVVLTREGEVWTWGMVLGDPPTFRSFSQDLAAKAGRGLGFRVGPFAPPPVFREKPWRLEKE
jgi:alpha-tubulin suppressor-like RCC1 family protein